MTYIIILALIAIVAALVVAGVSMIRDGRDGKPKTHAMMRALALRVGISVALFLCILAGYQLGWIRPTGLPLGG
jgi:predicted kinase